MVAWNFIFGNFAQNAIVFLKQQPYAKRFTVFPYKTFQAEPDLRRNKKINYNVTKLRDDFNHLALATIIVDSNAICNTFITNGTLTA